MDAEQFADLVRRHAGLIHKIAYTYCRHTPDREDVVQDIVLELWRARSRYDLRFKETTWIYRIAVNVAISHYRRERRHREPRESIDVHAITIATPAIEPSEDIQVLLRCIDDLDALDKALVLLYLDGHDHRSMADVLGISVSNVGTKLSRIKNRLRVAFEERAHTNQGAHHATR
jgi:RNA polymerase sigma factor (sigma-70 family)